MTEEIARSAAPAEVSGRTPRVAMPILLAIHLGVVFALFITLPYGKFVHGLYRFAALTRYALEQRAFIGKS